MSFNTYSFVLVFFPVCLTGWILLNKYGQKRKAKFFLLIMSFFFCGFVNVMYLLVLFVSIIVNYTFYKLMSLVVKHRKLVLIVGITLNIVGLLYFKYSGFFVDTINFVFGKDYVFSSVLLPLGISFYTFHQISFLVDAYRNEVPKYGFLEYALYISYFPKLSMGPIVRYKDIRWDITFNWENMFNGLFLFTMGLGKKVLLADNFGAAVDIAYQTISGLNSLEALFIMIAYGFQIYFDFSGYCDMARGISKMMGIELPINFNSPYKANNIVDFWDRWHITLTKFFTRYLYIPLGGNRKGVFRTYLNTMIVFLVSGLWHGAEWSYILWGAIHGIATVVTKMGQKRFKQRIPRVLSIIMTVFFVDVVWVFFRASNILQALHFFDRILKMRLDGRVLSGEITECFRLTLFKLFPPVNHLSFSGYLYTAIFLVLSVWFACIGINAGELADIQDRNGWKVFAIVLVLSVSILSFTGNSTYVYQYF